MGLQMVGILRQENVPRKLQVTFLLLRIDVSFLVMPINKFPHQYAHIDPFHLVLTLNIPHNLPFYLRSYTIPQSLVMSLL